MEHKRERLLHHSKYSPKSSLQDPSVPANDSSVNRGNTVLSLCTVKLKRNKLHDLYATNAKQFLDKLNDIQDINN